MQEHLTEQLDKNKMRETVIISASITGILLLVIILFFVARGLYNKQQAEAVVEPIASSTPEAIFDNPFEYANVRAYAAYVYDVQNQEILYAQNSSKALPLASLTKVMTAITASRVLGDGALVRINWQDLASDGNHGLIAGEHFRLRDLVDFMLVTSSNDAAMAIAETAGKELLANDPESTASPVARFVEEMNTLAAELDMTKAEFKNPSGLDENFEQEAGARASAQDVAKLFTYVLKEKPSFFEATRQESITISSKEGHQHSITNTNYYVDRLPNIIGSKTGFTSIAGGNLAVVVDPGLNTPVVIVVLGSTREERFTDVKQLSDILLEYYTLQSGTKQALIVE